MPKPLRIRELRAMMEMKELSLAWVSHRAGVPYTTCSEVLNGARVDAKRLAKLSKAITSAAMPQEVSV